MNKLLLTLSLAALTFTSAQAAGTIEPLNNVLFRFALDEDRDGTADRFATSADGFIMDIFYGPANTAAADLVQYPQFAVIGDYDGIFTGLPFLLELPGTEPFETTSVQMRFSNPLGWQAETRVNQIRLGPETGYGPVIWQRGRMGPVTATSAPDIFVVWNLVPEPSTLALGALGGVALLLRIRKSTKNK